MVSNTLCLVGVYKWNVYGSWLYEAFGGTGKKH